MAGVDVVRLSSCVRTGSALVLAVGLVACGADDPAPTAQATADAAPAGGSFVTQLGEPEHLTPTNSNESEGSQVLKALFTGLVSYDRDNKPVNQMAESIESPDQKVWTIKIKPGWTFHDGSPVVAKSFLDGWNYGALGANAQNNSAFFDKIVGFADLNPEDPDGEGPIKAPAAKAKELSGLKVVSDTEFTVTLGAPFSQFPTTLGYQAFYPAPPALLADPKKYGQAPVGNGPFKMDGVWKHNTAIKVTRFADYKGTPAKADAIEFRIYADFNTAYTDAQGGNIDIARDVLPERIASAPTDFPERFVEAPSSDWQYLGFPTYDKRFADPELRRAFSMAIDRDAITEKIFSGTRTPARSIVSPVVDGYRQDACGEACAYDPAKAKELFTKAGGFTGELTMLFNSGAGHDKWIEAVANNLRQNLGITDVKFKQLDFAQYLPLLDEKKLTGPYRLAWVMDYPSPQNYLEPIFSTKGSSNTSGYSSATVDKLIAEGNAASSVAAGIEKYHAAEDQILKDMPVIPMFFGLEQVVFSEKVGNVTVDAFGNIRLAEVTVKGG